MVRKKKITVETDNSTWKAPKTRKKRKPMTEEQRVAAAERLAKVREKKAAEDPSYGKSGVHESLWDLPKDHMLHPDKVKVWIKTQNDLAKSEKNQVRQNVKGSVSKLASHEGYVRQMKSYLKSGDWISDFYGEYEEKKIRRRCIALAYDKDGNPKRNVDVFYPDIGMVLEEDMI